MEIEIRSKIYIHALEMVVRFNNNLVASHFMCVNNK